MGWAAQTCPPGRRNTPGQRRRLLPGGVGHCPGRVGSGHALGRARKYSPPVSKSMSNNTLQPITLRPWIYVLRCKPREGTEYHSLYVGVSLDVHRRITQHFDGRGSRFTQAHSPVAVEALHVDTGSSNATPLEREQAITLELMRAHIAEHGEDAWRSVAGAGYSMPHQMRGRPRGL